MTLILNVKLGNSLFAVLFAYPSSFCISQTHESLGKIALCVCLTCLRFLVIEPPKNF